MILRTIIQGLAMVTTRMPAPKTKKIRKITFLETGKPPKSRATTKKRMR